MTTPNIYDQLHRTVDRLNPEQARVVLDVLKLILGDPLDELEPAEPKSSPEEHRFSFTGIIDGPVDRSERVDDDLEGFGEPRP